MARGALQLAGGPIISSLGVRLKVAIRRCDYAARRALIETAGRVHWTLDQSGSATAPGRYIDLSATNGWSLNARPFCRYWVTLQRTRLVATKEAISDISSKAKSGLRHTAQTELAAHKCAHLGKLLIRLIT